MKLVTLVSAGDPLGDSLFAYSDALIGSGWWKSTGSEYGLGAASGSVHLTGAGLSGDQSDAAMQAYVAATVGQAGGAFPDGKTLYLLYLPAGSNADRDGLGNTGCTRYGGYHHAYGAGGDGFAVVQRCPKAPLAELVQLTSMASHEIFEAATDARAGGYALGAPPSPPWAATVWRSYESTGGNVETADLCDRMRVKEGDWTYQRVWSNRAAATGGDPCVPSLAEPYFNTSAPEEWYSTLPGSKLQIPLTGFATGAREDWSIGTVVRSASAMGFSVLTDGPTHESLSHKHRPTLNNGRAATLTVFSPNAPKGSWAILQIMSYETRLDGNPPPDSESGDVYHYWLVGVYLE